MEKTHGFITDTGGRYVIITATSALAQQNALKKCTTQNLLDALELLQRMGVASIRLSNKSRVPPCPRPAASPPTPSYRRARWRKCH